MRVGLGISTTTGSSASASSTNTATPSDTQPPGGPSCAGPIAGGVIGGMAVGGLIASTIWQIKRRRGPRRSTSRIHQGDKWESVAEKDASMYFAYRAEADGVARSELSGRMQERPIQELSWNREKRLMHYDSQILLSIAFEIVDQISENFDRQWILGENKASEGNRPCAMQRKRSTAIFSIG